MIHVLMLSADPTDETRLRLGEEMREIQEKLQLAKKRRFLLHQRLSVRPSDISQALLDESPQIVHFSGHGTTTGAICVEDQHGNTHPIAAEDLAALFKQFSREVKCVVLNACYSEIQARTVAAHIDTVIGMNRAIGDDAAIAFSIGFYQALGGGRSVEEAYELGCVQIRLYGIPEFLTPVLIKKTGSTGSTYLANPADDSPDRQAESPKPKPTPVHDQVRSIENSITVLCVCLCLLISVSGGFVVAFFRQEALPFLLPIQVIAIVGSLVLLAVLFKRPVQERN